MLTTIKGNFPRSRFLSIVLLVLSLFFAAPAPATVKGILPDFYAEPGLNPFRDTVSANVTEHIDPFTGALTLTYTDLVIPGNGGFDIKIQRTYNSNNIYLSRKTATNIAPNLTQLLPRTATGLGWTLHMGRVLRTGGSIAPSICDTNATDPNDDTLNNPILELPDGRQQILFVNSTSFSALFITKEQWVAYCLSGSNGLLVISPEGVKYTMNYLRSGGFTYGTPDLVDYAWYPTRIEDRNGNYITITYSTLPSGKEALISSITASDGRTVSFGYTGTTATTVRLTSITANGQTWNYEYTPLSGYSGGYNLLTRVVRPDGSAWNYTYWNKATGAAGDNALQTVTYPYGATVTYDYAYVCFMAVTCSSAYDTFYSLVVSSKVNGGRDVTPATWTYTYSPSTSEDVTTVTFPGGSYVYRHYGSRMLFGGPTICGVSLWKIGLLKQKEIYNSSALVHRETYTWEPLALISNEEYVRPPYDGSDAHHPRYSDCAVYAPVLTQKQIFRDGTTYTTTYSNFDASFNPQTITESGQASRTINLTYFPRNANQNIVRLVKDEVIVGQPTHKNIYRTFDSNGNLTRITKHGVTENYTYHSTGDLNRRINARGKVWTYTNYRRGIPRTESHPEGITITRTVNDTGTIASETNGRGKTTTYTYDKLNRLTGITTPRTNDANISISWSSTGRTVTRGGYTQTITFDGFGRVSYIDTVGVTQDISYNALGHKSFESYYSSTTGDVFTTDVLGRVTSITHADGTSRQFEYLAGNVVRVTNERSYVTTYTYRSFGDPDRAEERVLMRIDAPEGVSTVFTRDILGLPTSVTQGGITRTYSYNTRNFLVSETNPETGTTTYGRDEVGNMTSRLVGSSGVTTYTYDGLNRLTAINYPGTTPDVAISYDGNNNVTSINNGVATRTFVYDDNDNLTSETLTIGSLSFTAAYAYNALDYLSAITYPSLRQVAYSPDLLGRPTAATPYLNAVTHHPNGVPATVVYANGQEATLGLNIRQWVESILARKVGGDFAQDLTYGYDGLGNVTSVTNGLDASDSKTMSYDGLDRLTSAGTAALLYDALGNITSYTTSTGSLTYSYDGANRLASVSGHVSRSFTYDVYGNVTSNGVHSFVYDDAGNLRTVTGVASYDYDGKNLRVRAVRGGLTTHYFYGLNGQLLGEYDAAGNWTKEYVYLGNKLVTAVENTGSGESINALHFDALGSPVAASDTSGNVIWRETYQPYGERVWNESAAATNTRWYTGHPQDSETGLIYAGARYYDPIIGRFSSVDPVDFTEANPQSFNRYAYGNNNPYRYVDRDGNVPIETVVDLGFVVYDAGRFLGAGAAYLHGVFSGDPALMAAGRAGLTESGIDFGGSLTGLAIPYAPAAITRGVGKGAGEVIQAAANTEPSKSVLKSIRSLERRLAEHRAKLHAYKSNPYAFDHKGYLKNAPSQEVRERIIEGRIRHLEREIRNFERQLEQLRGGGG